MLTLSGVNTYSGGTTLAGTLSLANNQALGTGALTTTGSVVDYANGVSIANAIVINSNTTQLSVTTGSATQAGAISELNGPRPLEKIGSGTLVLSGINTYSGPTTVSGGALVVTGSIANSALTVGSGTTLTGTGTVGGLTINSGGTFAPGNSPGTMTVQGNLAFQSGALYLVQVNSTTASNTVVSGSATLAGTVQAAFTPGSYATRMYTILSAAGGLGGTTFNALTTSNLPAGFTASLSYTATDAILNLTATLGQLASGPGAPSGPSALACAFSGNQCNVANAINAFFNNGGALPPNFLALFNLTGANLANALTLLSGEAATGAQQGAFQLGNQFLGIMLDPFVDGRSNPLGGSAIGFAPERAELPDDIARLCKDSESAAEAAKLRAALERVGRGLRRLEPHLRRSRGGGEPRSLRRHGRWRRRARLPPRARHGGGLRARRRRHQLGPGAGPGHRQERCVSGRRLRHGAFGFCLSRRRARLHQPLDVHRPLRLRRRSSDCELQRAVIRRTCGKRLSLHHVLWRAHALRVDPITDIPHAELQ